MVSWSVIISFFLSPSPSLTFSLSSLSLSLSPSLSLFLSHSFCLSLPTFLAMDFSFINSLVLHCQQ